VPIAAQPSIGWIKTDQNPANSFGGHPFFHQTDAVSEAHQDA